jgi:Tfp pilus assembly protein PilP
VRNALRVLAALAVAAAAGAAARAQDQPIAPAGEVSESMKALLEREVEPPPGAYTYSPAGRRDPFVSLIKPIEGGGLKGSRVEGMEGFLIQEVALKGIVKTKEGYIAMVVGPDTKAYFVKVGQRLFDGAITAMDQTSVTFRQEVTDPLSPVRVRDVRKSLYPSEEARQ